MTNDQQKKVEHLSFEQSILITLAPAYFFLLNGIIVHLLKSLEAAVHFFLLLPLIFIISVILLNQKHHFITRPNLKKFLPIYIIPALLATAHSLYYGTSLGGDSSSYFTNPIYTFYESGVFSHLELPFVSYGKQPLASYWIPYNSEFIFASIGSVFGLKFFEIVGLMHFTSNYLFGLAVFCILLRFVKFLTAVLLLFLFVTFFYGAHTNNADLVSLSLFRGFENKGIIWGFFFWSSINMFLPHTYDGIKPRFMLLAGLILGASSFLVSGNAVFLLFPAIVFLAGSVICRNFRVLLFQFIGFSVSLVLCIAIFKLLETTNVYDVVTEELTFRAPDTYQTQSARFKSPMWLWGLAIVLAGLAAIKNFQFASQLLTFIVCALLIQSELFFNLFFAFAPEFTLNFWRLATLMNPFLPILLATAYLFSKMVLPKQIIGIGSATAILIAMFTLGFLQLPHTSPFKQNKVPAQFLALAELCKSGSIILAERGVGTHLPVLQPSYKLLVGKEYFLNWQIANLKTQPKERQRALDVRDASLYISKSPITKNFGKKYESLVKVIANEKPDGIFLRTKKITSENEYLFSSYIKQTYGSVTAFTKPNMCRSDFKQIVTELRN